MRRVLGKNYRMLAEALRGTADARARHLAYRGEPRTVSAALRAIADRWPALEASADAPVFVLAAGWRTGSTLLQRLVMTHKLLIWGEAYTHCSLVDSLSSQLKAMNQRWPPSEFFVSSQGQDDLRNAWVANLYPELQRLRNAHTAFFDELFARPAAARGCPRWGLKEVLLTTEHAVYLRWLYPRARFLFLYRNPFDAWRSYRRWRRWYRRWPEQPVRTPAEFGRLWHEMTGDFLRNYARVGGLLVRYEELSKPRTRARLERYLEYPITPIESLERVSGASEKNHADKNYLPKIEKLLLSRQVEPLCSELGYRA